MSMQEYSVFQVFQHCPRCGAAGLTNDNVKRFQCNSCGFAFYVNMCGTVVAVLQNHARDYLFVRRAKDPGIGLLDLPGGFIDLDETAEQALSREVHEELSLEVVTAVPLFSTPNLYVFGELLYHTIDFYFRCDVADMGAIQISDEVSGYEFRSLGSISPDEIAFQSIRLGLEQLKERV